MAADTMEFVCMRAAREANDVIRGSKMKRPCRQYRSLLVVGTLVVLLPGCGGGGGGGSSAPPPTGNPPPPPPTAPQGPVQTATTPSDVFDGATAVTGTDFNGVEIQVIVDPALAGDFMISEGRDIGLPDDFVSITNEFIEIEVPAQAEGELIVRVAPSAAFEVIVTADLNASELEYAPFFTADDGYIEFFAEPIDGAVTFALMDVPEF